MSSFSFWDVALAWQNNTGEMNLYDTWQDFLQGYNIHAPLGIWTRGSGTFPPQPEHELI